MKNSQIKPLVAIALVLLLAFSVYQKQMSLGKGSALIIDQLHSENQEYGFSEKCRNLLESVGYRVRVYSGEEVSLDLLRSVDWGADVVVLRMHSGVFDNRTWLFTHEKYDSAMHVLEQLSGETNIGVCDSVDYPVFTVSSAFFGHNIQLDGCLVVAMGCNGLEMDDLGQVLVEKGAGAVVGWDRAVTIEKTDTVVLGFLEEMLSGLGLDEALDGSGMCYRPVGAEGFRLG